MTLSERLYGVWLGEIRAGTLAQRGDHTRFSLSQQYLSDPDRPVLGLIFEQDLSARHAAALRLPAWFSNLLPEGRLREWIAAERGVSAQREMELLAQVGHDLPGAVRVAPVENLEDESEPWDSIAPTNEPATLQPDSGWRFSLAGVALKFSMLIESDRVTLPATGVGGNWIVKLPDRLYVDVPRNEYAMMMLAKRVGIDVPDVRLVHRDEVEGLPAEVWSDKETLAYAVKRFDRVGGALVHMEDLAQVRNVYPVDKYAGNYETVSALVYRGHDEEGLREFARRLIFSVLISNGDAHLKNWSILYTDPRRPTLSPAYDLVSTRHYMGPDEKLALKISGTREFHRVRVHVLGRLEDRLGVKADLEDVGREVIAETVKAWPEIEELLGANAALRTSVATSIHEHASSLLAGAGRP